MMIALYCRLFLCFWPNALKLLCLSGLQDPSRLQPEDLQQSGIRLTPLPVRQSGVRGRIPVDQVKH